MYNNNKSYPLPTPATYPSGAGTPRKCFLFRLANAAAVIFAIINFCSTIK